MVAKNIKKQKEVTILNKEQKLIDKFPKNTPIQKSSQNSNKSKKVSKEIKLEIIHKYLSGKSTQKELSKEYNVTVSSISRWLNEYKKYGEDVI